MHRQAIRAWRWTTLSHRSSYTLAWHDRGGGIPDGSNVRVVDWVARWAFWTDGEVKF